jgi:hypothetical protein
VKSMIQLIPSHLVGGKLRAAWFARVAKLTLLVVLFMTMGCGQQNQQTTGGTQASPTIPPGDFENPVIRSDFPDPSVLQVGHTYYAYATNAFGKNVQVARSQDMVHWDLLPDAMPALPSWAQPGGSYVWAP